MATRQEAQWVLRAQCGDREALELLLRAVEPALRRYLTGLVGAGDSSDVLQDVLLLIYRKLTWLEDPGLFRPWTYRIASREAFRWLKRKARRAEDPMDEATLNAVHAPEARLPEDLVADLHRIEGVSPASRAVLMLHFQEDLPLADVAAILGIAPGTAKSRLAYGLAALRGLIRERRS